MAIESPARQDYLSRETAHGDAVIAHGYAVTGHIAQGLTTDGAFVLASDEMYREWAYTAMSRGRETNRLYMVENAVKIRDEFAPAKRSAAETELVASARQSRRQLLALDTRAPAIGDSPSRPDRVLPNTIRDRQDDVRADGRERA